jgi:hypothetical protein
MKTLRGNKNLKAIIVITIAATVLILNASYASEVSTINYTQSVSSFSNNPLLNTNVLTIQEQAHLKYILKREQIHSERLALLK